MADEACIHYGRGSCAWARTPCGGQDRRGHLAQRRHLLQSALPGGQELADGRIRLKCVCRQGGCRVGKTLADEDADEQERRQDNGGAHQGLLPPRAAWGAGTPCKRTGSAVIAGATKRPAVVLDALTGGCVTVAGAGQGPTLEQLVRSLVPPPVVGRHVE